MIELTRTNRITIGVVVILVVILLGFIFVKPVKYSFNKPMAETLKEMDSVTYAVSPKDLAIELLKDDTQWVLIDVRSPYEFANGHLDAAQNLATVNILDDDNYEMLEDYQKGNKRVVFLGASPDQANVPFTLLYQMGFDNLAYVEAGYDYFKGKSLEEIAQTTFEDIDEEPIADFAQFIVDERAKAAKKAQESPKPVVKAPQPVKINIRPKTEVIEDEGC